MNRCYFIGGPDDLTIRALNYPPPKYFEVALFPNHLSLVVSDGMESPESDEAFKLKRGRYMLVGKGYMNRNVYVYEWVGVV